MHVRGARQPNADLNRTSGKSEPVGLEGAGRNPESHPPTTPPQTAFWHTPRKKSELMAHQMLKGKILSPVIEGPAGQPCMGKCSQGPCLTKIVSTKILLYSERLADSSEGGGVTTHNPMLTKQPHSSLQMFAGPEVSCSCAGTAAPISHLRAADTVCISTHISELSLDLPPAPPPPTMPG